MTDQTPIEQLITALRSPLPAGFRWDFRWYPSCALALAGRIGIDCKTILAALGNPEATSRNPFASWPWSVEGGVVPLYGVPACDVTPTMVADALELIVADGVPTTVTANDSRDSLPLTGGTD